MLKKLILFFGLLTTLSFGISKEVEDYFKDDNGQPLSKQALKIKNAMTQLETRNMPVQYKSEPEDVFEAFNKQMSDIKERDEIEALYKKPTDFNPEDLTFADKVSALGNMFNITSAYLQKQDILETTDVSEKLMTYNDKEFSMENALYEAKNPHFSNYLKDNPVDSWEGYLKQEAYFKELERDKKIVSETVSPWVSIPTMIVFGAFDIYTLFILILIFTTPIKIYILKLFQDLSTNGKIKIAIFTIATGILYGAIFSYLHKAITGIKISNHLEYSMFLGAIIFSIIAIIYTLCLIKRQKENITEQYNTIFIKKMLSYNTNLEQKIYNQNSATQSEHTAIIVFLIGFFGYLYFSKGGKSESFRQTNKYSDNKTIHKLEELGYKNIYHFLENYTDWEKNYIDENIKLINEYKFHNAEGYNAFINLGLQVAFHLFQEYKHSSTLKSFGVVVPTEQIAINLIQEFNLMLDELKKF
ncbi:hypothetical protein [Aliarcobacter cryaerophilus]|uniref:hypothetical protein n=1 Tax=Aliarcobacter cryaerophilus TaxID=28198 RepID=UPI0021B655FF|nr:hypothetical protein [Aliarcobacter cryaerophilus]MCT7541706.1 hypothetical protein [Aliarcobacter cryaerophilus]